MHTPLEMNGRPAAVARGGRRTAARTEKVSGPCPRTTPHHHHPSLSLALFSGSGAGKFAPSVESSASQCDDEYSPPLPGALRAPRIGMLATTFARRGEDGSLNSLRPRVSFILLRFWCLRETGSALHSPSPVLGRSDCYSFKFSVSKDCLVAPPVRYGYVCRTLFVGAFLSRIRAFYSARRLKWALSDPSP
jgi:hypothetical protein